MDRYPFEEYIKQGEPDKRDKGYIWATAAGLCAVDGIKPSKNMLEVAVKKHRGTYFNR